MTDLQKETIKDLYPKRKVSEIAELLGLDPSQVSGFVYRNNLKPTETKVGDEFGKLKVVSIFKDTIKGRTRTYTFCDCECGTKNYKVLLTSLDRDITTDCGCSRLAKNRWTEEQKTEQKNCETLYLAFGESKSIIEWSRDSRCKVDYKTFKKRLYRGWPVELALTDPIRKNQFSVKE